MESGKIILLYSCNAWHEWSSMKLIASFTSRPLLKVYLKKMIKDGELDDEDFDNLVQSNQSHGKDRNYHIEEQDLNPEYEDKDGKKTPRYT